MTRGLTLFFTVTAICSMTATASLFAQPTFDCPVTAREDRLRVVGPMAGSDPIWLVDGSFGTWRGKDAVVSAWAFSSKAAKAAGKFQVTGRRIDAPGVMQFQVGMDGEPSEHGVIKDIRKRSVIPGGSTPEIINDYVFVMMYLIYPSPGCWEITAQLGEHKTRIVTEQIPQDGR